VECAGAKGRGEPNNYVAIGKFYLISREMRRYYIKKRTGTFLNKNLLDKEIHALKRAGIKKGVKKNEKGSESPKKKDGTTTGIRDKRFPQSDGKGPRAKQKMQKGLGRKKKLLYYLGGKPGQNTKEEKKWGKT